jgi:energy-coupling factor transport system ATP-binding protein
METRKTARAVLLVAVAVALSPFFIPVGIAKCFPAQHMVNVLGAVLLGPGYALAIAATAAVLRNVLGVGTLLAFPGGMIGALLAGLCYRLTKNIYAAALGEVFGTGVLGTLVSVWIVAPLLMGKTMALAALMIAFGVSTVGGAVLALVALHFLRKGGLWEP